MQIRNCRHPADTESFYLKGVALEYLGRYEESYDILYRAAWNYTHRSAALFELACIDCIKHDYVAALEKLEESIGLNQGHTKAQNLKTTILRTLGYECAKVNAEANIKDDQLDLFAMVEYSHFADNKEQLAQFTLKSENILDIARDYMKAGFYEDALAVLELDKEGMPLVDYYRAYEDAVVYKAAVSELSLFRALALKELGQNAEAENVLREMLETAESSIINKDRRSYYGVGSPSPMPFELDVEKLNLMNGYTLKAFALYGMEDYSNAQIAIRSAEAIDPYDFRVYAFQQII